MIGDAENSVTMAQLVTGSSGWALTRTRLAWTGDGARSWRTITPRKIPAGRLRGAFLLDQRTGWVVASAKTRETGSLVRLAVYRTTDAGATWRRYSLGPLDLGKTTPPAATRAASGSWPCRASSTRATAGSVS
jgi:photosystem II stability/assembly factor-like uncharacterized protein